MAEGGWSVLVQYGWGCTSIVSVGCVVDHPGEDVDEEQEDGDKEGCPGGRLLDSYTIIQ